MSETQYCQKCMAMKDHFGMCCCAPSGSLERVVRAHDIHGGKWLGAAREWLQWNTLNGDSVTWGSSDVLRPNMTVKMVEEMAAHIAAAAINEERERVCSNESSSVTRHTERNKCKPQ